MPPEYDPVFDLSDLPELSPAEEKAHADAWHALGWPGDQRLHPDDPRRDEIPTRRGHA